MRIIFRKIPVHTSPKELTLYIKPSLSNGVFNLFKRPGKITRVDILAQKDPDSNVIRHHGLATILPDKAAKRTIHRLNKIPFHGKNIFVREFFNRSKRNDPRKASSNVMSLQHKRRSAERRTHTLEKVTNFGISFSDRSQFSRKRGF